ncbi:MAG: thiaminase II [Rhodospirillaceae bacterium]
MEEGSNSLFGQLRAACLEDWQAYVEHAFVRQMGDGTLPQDCFKHYLAQDYLFLIHFSRAYALAAYKSETLEEIKAAGEGMAAILGEMELHVALCGRWGVTREALEALPEAKATMAYTRYVLERGLSGDLLDLHVALAPCVIGYGEIGRALAAQDRPDHPYHDWIGEYAGDGYQGVAQAAVETLDRLYASRGGPGRLDGLVKTFRQATVLEAEFWQMGLDLSS